MSMTLETLWSLHEVAQQADIAPATDVLARRGGRFSFFFGPVWLLLIVGIGALYYQFRQRNPEKAKGFEQRLRGMSAAATQRATPTGYGPAGTPMRFNPPPNWPPPPPGWVPGPDWKPDPSWPPAPEGWQFWVA